MTPERWRRVNELFHSALEQGPEQRDQYLEQACGGDRGLRAEVESLLASHEQTGYFIDRPAFHPIAHFLDDEPELSFLGKCIGRYTVLSMLGRGGMGEVYLARDAKLERNVALKLLLASFTRDQDRLRRFQQEARAASALNHPNIITIYDMGEEKGIQFIAMEFIEGETIRERLGKTGFTITEALEITRQAGNALRTAHEAGIAHRDVKPENIMLRRDGYVKVLDFGLAKLTDPSGSGNNSLLAREDSVTTEPGAVMGSVGYMSPEQARGLPVDARTDIFSLGVVLYEMLAGTKPFKGATQVAAITAMLEEEPPALGPRVTDALPALEAVVLKALRKSRDERYQAIAAFLADLRAAENSGDSVVSAAVSAVVSPAVTEAAPRPSSATGLLARSTAAFKAAPAARTPLRLLQDVARRVPRRPAPLLALTGALTVAVVAVFLLIRGGRDAFGPPAGGPFHSVAILPLENATSDPEAEYLSDGLTESLINSLSRLPGLTVMSRSAVFRYKGSAAGALQAGRQLGVETAASGKVLKDGDHLSISLELIEVGGGRRIWQRHYTDDLGDILSLQGVMAQEISTVLLPGLTDSIRKVVAKSYTESADAYVAYSKGRFFLNKRNPAAARQSIDQFKQAAAVDAGYALAYDGLADAYILLADYGDQRPKEALPLAEEAVNRALRLDGNLAEAHTTLGHLELFYYRNWAEAGEEFKRAIELKPRYAEAHQGYATFFAALGRFKEALSEIDLALLTDRWSAVLNHAKGLHLYLAGRYDDAIAQLQQTVEIDDTFAPAHAVLGMAYLEKGLKDKAVVEFEALVARTERNPAYLAQLGRAYAAKGEPEKAQLVVQELKQAAHKDFVPSSYFARIYAALGNADQAFRAIDRAYDEQDSELIFIKTEPAFAPLRAYPQFGHILSRMHLDQ